VALIHLNQPQAAGTDVNFSLSDVLHFVAQEVISDRLVTWVKSQLLLTAPSYGPYLAAYEKGCPTKLAAETQAEGGANSQAEAQAPSSGEMSSSSPMSAPSEGIHGLISSSRAIEAEPAPQIPPELD
jgi:hypothetical protein